MDSRRFSRWATAKVQTVLLFIGLLSSILVLVWISQTTVVRSRHRSGSARRPADQSSLIGMEAPRADFRAVEPDRDVMSLESLRGKVILVSFWGTWCQPCRLELPELIKIWRSLEHDERFQFIAVASGRDSVDSVRRFQAQSGCEFPAYTASTREVFDEFHLRGYPTNLLIDAEGRIRYYHTGYSDALPPVLNHQIHKLLDEIDESEGT